MIMHAPDEPCAMCKGMFPPCDLFEIAGQAPLTRDGHTYPTMPDQIKAKVCEECRDKILEDPFKTMSIGCRAPTDG